MRDRRVGVLVVAVLLTVAGVAEAARARRRRPGLPLRVGVPPLCRRCRDSSPRAPR